MIHTGGSVGSSVTAGTSGVVVSVVETAVGVGVAVGGEVVVASVVSANEIKSISTQNVSKQVNKHAN